MKQEISLITHNAHTQQANKILSKAKTLEETQSKNTMLEDIADLKERNVELMSIITDIKESHYQDQKKLIGLESELENTKRKVDMGVHEIRKCKSALTKVETRLALLLTKEDTTSRFDRIKAILMGGSYTPAPTSREQIKLLTGKRKGKTSDYENASESDEEESFQDIQEPMETEQGNDNNLVQLTQTGGGDQINSQTEHDTAKTQLK
jgi:hypothetical protein